MELVNAPTPDDDVHMHDEKTTVRTQEFSAELLNVYYSRLFPYNEMYRWLSYGNTYGVKNTIDTGIDKNNKKVTVGQPEYFFHREISFTLDVSGEEVYIRYLNFKNAEEMRKKIMQQQPRKIDIGAIYSHEPSKHDMIPANVFKPLERELVFDIDLTDYDDVGAKGADISRVCILFYYVFLHTHFY
jgi:DNA primase small subunit